MSKRNIKKCVIQSLDGDIKQLREKGYSLEYIGGKGGVTRERIRQVINKYYPGTKPKSFSESQVANMLGISTDILRDRRKKGLVHPVKIGNTYRYDEKILEDIKLLVNRPCRICGEPIPSGHIKLCEKCSLMMRNPKLRLTLPGEREKHKIHMIRWKETHKRA